MTSTTLPKVGETWEVLFKHRSKHEQFRQMKLIKETEMSYIFVDPDDNAYCPVRWNIRKCHCVLNEKIETDFQTRINGFPDAFYDERMAIGPQKPRPSVFWQFDASKYTQ